MLKRKVFQNVIKKKLLCLDFAWFFHRAWTYIRLKGEKFLKTGRAPGPLMAVLIVTENCNLRCPMCSLPSRAKKISEETDTLTWKRVIDDLNNINVAGIGFTGGEPAMRKDIFELISCAASYDFPITFNTNTLAIGKDRIEELIRSKPSNINISIDSGREEVNDSLRGGKNILARTLEQISRLVSLREKFHAEFTITAVTVLSDLNIDDLEILFKKVSQAGVDRIGFMPLHDISKEKCSVARFEKDTSALAETIWKLSEKYRLDVENSKNYINDFHSVISGNKQMPMRCNAAYTSVVIGPDLKLYRCWPYFEKGQSFRQWDPERETLKDLWNENNYCQERLRSLTCRECFWNCHAELNYLIHI